MVNVVEMWLIVMQTLRNIPAHPGRCFLLLTRACYVIGALRMRFVLQSMLMGVGLCMTLAACENVQKQRNHYDLYELRPVGAPIDNDSYYVPPKPRALCGSINVSPSCGGG